MKVLACAGSNIAIDNIVERLVTNGSGLNVCRLGHPARMLSQIYDQCLDNKIMKTSSFKVLKDLKKNYDK
jgi:superfamily I DNA and/or RNA helicase